MELKTKEFVIRFLEERIIVLEQKENVVRMTKEGAHECLAKMVELCDMNDHPKAIVFYVRSLYIKKDAMRVFTETPNHETMTCIGLISTSFIAKNVANMILKMRARFVTDDILSGIFSTETAAIEWVRSILSTKS